MMWGALSMLAVMVAGQTLRDKTPPTPIIKTKVVRVPTAAPTKPAEAALPSQETGADLTGIPEPKPAEKTHAEKKRATAKAPLEPTEPPGVINLVTRGGWAHIYKDGERIGTTPRKLKLPSGRHLLELQAFGEGPFQTVYVTVVANRTKKVSIQLDQ